MWSDPPTILAPRAGLEPATKRLTVIAHARPGLHKVYDLHAYQEEKRRCLELWEGRLLSIVVRCGGEKVVHLLQRRGEAV